MFANCAFAKVTIQNYSFNNFFENKLQVQEKNMIKNLPEVIKDIGRIGWLKFIAWFIVFVIINIILGLIASVIGLIPYVGIIIASILVETYVLFFTGRAIGLMYSNA